MKTLEEKLGYQFRDRRLLENALTHSSFANEHHMGAVGSNERLEFLGDSVLGMVVADDLFHRYSRLPEGDLTRLRAQLVCEASLARVARELELGSYLCLGKGEESTGGRERPSIIADAVEAVLAAVYLDSGSIREPRRIIRKFILEHMEEAREASRDHKTHLQELVQRRSGQVLSYHLIGQSGPDHNKSFEMEVRLNGETVGTGTGRSKKEAEQMAARAAIAKLEEE
jgi:ribonuclease-3